MNQSTTALPYKDRLRQVAIISSVDGLPVLDSVWPDREEALHAIKFARDTMADDGVYVILPFVGRVPT